MNILIHSEPFPTYIINAVVKNGQEDIGDM